MPESIRDGLGKGYLAGVGQFQVARSKIDLVPINQSCRGLPYDIRALDSRATGREPGWCEKGRSLREPGAHSAGKRPCNRLWST